MREVGWSVLAIMGTLAGCGYTPEPVVSTLTNPGFQSEPPPEEGDKTALDGGPKDPVQVGTDPGTCAAQAFDTRLAIPDIIIALDRSASMQSSSVDRWTPAVAAIKSITTAFEQGVSFGLILFPALSDSCAPGTMEVNVAPGNASTISRALAKTAPFGATPTGETLQAVLAAFRLRGAVNPGAPPPRYLLLVTDGEPTCPSAEGNPGRIDGLTADKLLTLQAIDALRAEGVLTYVLGFDSIADLRFAGSMNEFAQHGGTERYYSVQNEETLFATLDTIADAAINCSFDFAANVIDPDPALVRVTLDGMTLRPNDPNGWSMVGRTVTVRGDACAQLQGGQQRRIEIALECTPIVYL